MTATAQKTKVLIAEDDDLNMFIISQLVEELGYEVIQAEDGERAVEAALSHRPAIILMDISMPKLNGVEAAKNILSALGAESPIIIAVTANVTDRQRRECDEAGFKAFQTKPIDFAAVEQVLANVKVQTHQGRAA